MQMTGLIGGMTGKSTFELRWKASHYNYLQYMGSGINGKNLGGPRDNSNVLLDHKPWDRDQKCCEGCQG